MTLSLDWAVTCKGISSDIGTYGWHGHSFNPSCDPTYNDWNPWDDDWAGYDYVDDFTSLDVSDLRYGNEAVMFSLRFSSDVSDSGSIVIGWYDTQDNLLFSFSMSYSISAAGWYGCWSGIGIKAGDHNEIHDNGTYKVIYTVTGDNILTDTVYFTISGHPGGTSATAGYLWVEDEELAFASAQGYKILVHNDGAATYVGIDYAGYIWLEETGKITYVDEYGYKRNTKLGDRYGYEGWSSEIPATPGTTYQGYIWVSNDNNDTYLVIVSPTDGRKYRIGAGYYDTGDYQ